MERAALIGGIILAIVIALGAFARHPIHISIDGDDLEFGAARAAYIEPSPGQMAATTYSETEVRLIHSAAFVRVITEDRQDVSVEISNPGRAPMPQIERRDGRVVIDGRLASRIDGCEDDGSAVRLDGYGTVARTDLPQITIRAPRALDFDARGAVFSEIAASQSAELSFAGCGDSTIGDVAGRLELDAAGAGDIRGGAAGEAKVDIAGSGSVTLGAVGTALDVDIAGSGQFAAASLNGPLEISTAGSGDFRVGGGQVTTANVDIAGSGDVTINAAIQRLEADIMGSGSVAVGGTVGDVDASIAGSGDVTVEALTGNLSQSSMGSGSVVVRNRAPAPAAPAAP